MGQIIIVRSLTNSDLGIFAAHRASATSKQRAININAPCAEKLLTPSLYGKGGTELDCIVTLAKFKVREPRWFGKIHKNWRLGGNKIEGHTFASVDSRDFMLLRSEAPNDGSAPVMVTFVARALDRALHARIGGIVAYSLKGSMLVYDEADADFALLEKAVSEPPRRVPLPTHGRKSASVPPTTPVPPMPREEPRKVRGRTVKEKVRSAALIEQMLKVSSDLSAPAQLRFMDTVEQLATQLRDLLLHTKRIITVPKDHAALWGNVAGQRIAFVDGGMANLAMIGAAPVAVRVGGYLVTPGDTTASREQFTILKKLISELYAGPGGGVYDGSFPDYGALRDAARISLEAAGSVTLLKDNPDVRWLFLHGALVNPVSRYTDVMRDRKAHRSFPDFTAMSMGELLPGEAARAGRDTNFISVYLRQLELLNANQAVVCGVVEREGHTTTVMRAILDALKDYEIQAVLPDPPEQWKAWFRSMIDPADDPDAEGPRITDTLLFRCVLEPGEALLPVPINRNDLRRAPGAWKDKIALYPVPWVSYIQVTEWSAPLRVEIFEKDLPRYPAIAALAFHCALLLPRYAFPVGLDIVDKFAHIPNWMSRPVSTNTAVHALKIALDRGDTQLFNALRRMLCGSQREWLLRPRT